MHVARASAPTPSYSSAMWGAWKSEATSASYAAFGKVLVSSTSAACGAILSSATLRTASRKASWSSEMVKKGKSPLPVLTIVTLLRESYKRSGMTLFSKRCMPEVS